MSSSESFQQLAMRSTDAMQHEYESIRGIMLADETIAKRSRISGVDRDTMSEKGQCFLEFWELADEQ